MGFPRLAVSLLAVPLAGGLIGAVAPPPVGAPVLSQPIACKLGQDCFVQQYFDHDPGPGAKDYRCGARVYDKHDGIDIRLPSVAAQQRGVAVLAAAAGTVKAARDGEADHLIASPADRAAISGRECGNGVVIDHVGGWQTQYCHMAKGSIAVKPGQAVRAGDRLGLVGLSGDTEFPHVHLSLRQGARKVDPFAPDAAPGQCSATGGRTLWSPQAAQALSYRATEIINLGFASEAVTMAAVEAEGTRRPDAASPALIFFGRAIGLQAGDVVKIELRDPSGQIAAQSARPIDRAKAQWLGFAGRKRPAAGWPKGRYRATFTVERGAVAAVRKEADLTL
jgi:hypothetical protein